MNPWQSLFVRAEESPRYLIGVMSGTSGDGADAALVRFNGNAAELVTWAFTPFTPGLRERVLQAQNGDANPEALSRLSVELATV